MFEYSIFESAAVISKYTGEDEIITVPDSYEGYLVTGIGDHCFSNCLNVKEIILSNNIKTIGNYAFVNCTNLNHIVLSENLENIGNDIFYGGNNIQELYIHAKVKDIHPSAFYSLHNTLIIFDTLVNTWFNLNLNDCYTFYQGLPLVKEVRKKDMISGYLEARKLHKEMDPTIKEKNEKFIQDYFSFIFKLLLQKDLTMQKYLLTHYELSLWDYDDIEETVMKCNDIELTSLYLTLRNRHYTKEEMEDFEKKKERWTLGDYTEEDYKEIWELEKLSDEKVLEYERLDPIHNYHNTYCVVSCHPFISDGFLPSVIDGKKISTLALDGQSNLHSIMIEEGVYCLEENCFHSYIEDIYLPDSMTFMKANSFDGCYQLKHIHLSANLTYIPEYCFQECYQLDDVVIPDSVETIEQYAFHQALFKSLKVNNVKYIHDYAFLSSNARYMQLPDSVEYIGYGAFKDSYLPMKGLPSHCVNVGDLAFTGNFHNDIFVPKSVISIGEDAFAYNPFFTSITLEDREIPLIIKDGAFYQSGKKEVTLNGKMILKEEIFADNIEKVNLSSNIEFMENTFLEDMILVVPLNSITQEYCIKYGYRELSRNNETVTYQK